MSVHVMIQFRADGQWRWVRTPCGSKMRFRDAEKTRAFHERMKERGSILDYRVEPIFERLT